MKSEKFNNFLLGTLIVLVSISIYNVNVVSKGVSSDYFKGLIMVFAISLALSALFIAFVNKPRRAV